VTTRQWNVDDPRNYEFAVVLRGYDRAQVDATIEAGRAAAVHGSDDERSAARAMLTDVTFDVVLRGYDRIQVDAAVTGLIAALAG
jgi:DivIVA domain-containing protein